MVTANMATVKTVPLAEIVFDERTQARVTIDSQAVEEYAESLRCGHVLPPVDLFGAGEEVWIGDGWHRVLAHLKAELPSIEAHVYPGGFRDALLFAVGANGNHGLRRTIADKRRAIEILLTDDEWAKLSDRELARITRTSHPFVGSFRRERAAQLSPVPAVSGNVAAPTEPAANGNIATSPEPAKTAESGNIATPEPSDESTLELKIHAETPPPPEVTDDSNDAEPQVPDRLKPTFGAVPEFRSTLKRIADLKADVQKLAESPAGVLLNFTVVKRHLEDVHREVRYSMPHAVCPYCRAESGNCDACDGRGWVNEAVFNQSPEDLK